MFRQNTVNNNAPLRFHRWSRKGYAAFASLHNEVVIGVCAISISSKLTPKNIKTKRIMLSVSQLEEKVLNGEHISAEEALWLVQFAEKEALYAAANRIRAHYCGSKIDLCTIMNARSGRCTEDCKWCSQSSQHKTGIKEYELADRQEAIDLAKTNRNAGAHRFSFVTSGHNISHKNLDTLCSFYSDIAKDNDIHLCASMGLTDMDKLIKLQNAGIKTYGCNIETGPSYFSKLCTTHTIPEKIKTLKSARALGMELCSGGIIGMGETMNDRIEMAMILQELGVESIPLNILNAVKGTALQDFERVSDEEILSTFAMFRFCNPKANIRFAGGRIHIKHMQDRALKAGINSALIGDLLTTIGTNMKEDIINFKKAGFDVSK